MTTSKQVVSITAHKINSEYRKAKSSMVDSANHIIECGRLLTDKKKELGHGNFTPWVEVECEFTPDAARRMMRASRKQESTLVLTEDDALEICRDTWGNVKIRGTQGTGDNEWYTPEKYIDAVREVLGEIDLDPASSKIAQKTVRANRYFTEADDGLQQSWQADTVYLNPPYAQPHIYNFVEKLLSELVKDNINEAILLTHNYTDTLWFHRAEEVASAICFTRGRIKFVDAEGEEAAPTQGQAFFYFGEYPEVFASRFKEFGFVR